MKMDKKSHQPMIMATKICQQSSRLPLQWLGCLNNKGHIVGDLKANKEVGNSKEAVEPSNRPNYANNIDSIGEQNCTENHMRMPRKDLTPPCPLSVFSHNKSCVTCLSTPLLITHNLQCSVHLEHFVFIYLCYPLSSCDHPYLNFNMDAYMFLFKIMIFLTCQIVYTSIFFYMIVY